MANENDFFKNFTHSYSKRVNESIVKFFGKKFSEKSPAFEGKQFDKMIKQHIAKKNDYRKELPALFNSVNQGKYKQLEDNLAFLKAAPLPEKVQRTMKQL
jgi:hypothetical protein